MLHLLLLILRHLLVHIQFVTDGNGCTAQASETINSATDCLVMSSTPTCNSTTIGIANDQTASALVSG